MEREEIISVANLLNVLKEYSPKLEQAIKNQDYELLSKIKKEIISLTDSINRII